MHWTHTEVIELLKAATPFVVAVNTIIASVAAWQAKRAKDHVQAVAVKVDSATAKVDEVHNCLADAKEEVRQGIMDAKTEAADAKEVALATTKTVNRLEVNTNNKMDQLLASTNAASFQAGAQEERGRQEGSR